MKFVNTREAAKLLGLPVSKVQRALWNEKFQLPLRGPSGCFLWTQDDLNRASWALLHRSFKAVLFEANKNNSLIERANNV